MSIKYQLSSAWNIKTDWPAMEHFLNSDQILFREKRKKLKAKD
jgi:hypothetical protein